MNTAILEHTHQALTHGALEQAKDRLARAMTKLEETVKSRVSRAEAQVNISREELLALQERYDALLKAQSEQNATMVSAELVKALQEEISTLKDRMREQNESLQKRIDAFDELEAASELAIDTLDMTIDELKELKKKVHDDAHS
jgi:vacuolar-type H+-ATPase subunit I/STV1